MSKAEEFVNGLSVEEREILRSLVETNGLNSLMEEINQLNH
jgi:hypothetical protein